MKRDKKPHLSRRRFLQKTGATGAGLVAAPYLSLGASAADRLVTRPLGRTGVEVTTFGLGGQASLQWTPEDVDPVEIIVKAVNRGVNYFDTSNVYGESQVNYGKAFRVLGLAPGQANYDEKKRRSLFVASKTMLRYARGTRPGMVSFTNGPQGSTAVDDLKRTLSQVFGDGKGHYPEDAYLDLFQMHNLTEPADVEGIYDGLYEDDPERIGTLAAVLDYRDGTNRTGLNPKEEKLIRRIGISGHHSSPLMIDCIQRDDKGIIETMLVATNANDRQYLNHQHNVLPLAAAKGLGIIGMKVFADGAMYTKGAHWTRGPQEIVRSIGTKALPSEPLIQYALSLPGVATTIIGIGHVDSDPKHCQLEQNLAATRLPDPLDEGRRHEIEEMAMQAKTGQTNWYQRPAEPLSPPQDVSVTQEGHGGERVVKLTWHTAYAGNHAISHYEVLRDDESIAKVDHRPQISKAPFTFDDHLSDRGSHRYRLVTVDGAGNTAPSHELRATVEMMKPRA